MFVGMDVHKESIDISPAADQKDLKNSARNERAETRTHDR